MSFQLRLVTVKVKFHYASWFEAGRRQVQIQIPLRCLVRSWSATGFEPASNQLRTRQHNEIWLLLMPVNGTGPLFRRLGLEIQLWLVGLGLGLVG